MKILGYLLMTLSVMGASLAAATAYHAPLSLPASYFFPDENSQPIKIKAEAGTILLPKDGNDFLAKLKAKRSSSRRILETTACVNLVQPEANVFPLALGLLERINHASPEEFFATIALERVSNLDQLKWDEKSGLLLTAKGNSLALFHAWDKKNGIGNTLNQETLAILQDQAKSEDPNIKQHYVILQEFSWQRWPGLWYFLTTLATLFLGALMVRRASKKELQIENHASEKNDPIVLLRSLQHEISTLLSQFEGLSADGNQQNQLKHTLDKLSQVHANEVTNFVESRAFMVGKYGLSGFAHIMDRFAALERQLNRAWSACADGVYIEVIECLKNADVLVAETLATLKQFDANAV